MSENNDNEEENEIGDSQDTEESSDAESNSRDINDSSVGEGFVAGLSDEVAIAIGILALFALVGGLYAASTTGVLDPGNENQPPSAFNYSAIDGADKNGISNNSKVINTHVSSLVQQSYTIDAVTTSENRTVDLTYQFDSDKGVGYTVQNIQDGSKNGAYENFSNRQRYVAQNLDGDNQTYDRLYITASTPYVADTQTFEFLATTNLTVDRVTQGPNGENVAVYEVQNVRDNFSDQFSIEGEIHLSQEGYFRYIDVKVETLQNGSVINRNEQTLEVLNVGSTSVQEPSWVSEARQQTEEAQPPRPPQNNVTIQPQNETEG
jgi:hypothetical protein